MNHKPVLDRIARHLGREYGRNATGAVYHVPGEGYHVISYDNTTWYPYDESGEPVLGYGATRSDHATSRSALRHSGLGLAQGNQWPDPIADIKPIMEHTMKRSELRQIIREEIRKTLKVNEDAQDFIKEGKTIGALIDADDDLYLEAKAILKKEFSEFLKEVDPKLMKIVNKATKNGRFVIKSNLRRYIENRITDIHKEGFLK